MRIVTPDGTIEITRGSFDEPWDLDAVVHSMGFGGRVTNIFPRNTAEFFAEIRSIERRNEGRATLVGTEDFAFTMELPAGRGDFWAEITLSAGFATESPARSLRCRLRVEGEYWSSTVSGLRTALVGYPPAS